MEKIIWLDTLTNKEVLGRANEKWENAELCLAEETAMDYSNNNNHDDIYSAVFMTRSLREFTRFIW